MKLSAEEHALATEFAKKIWERAKTGEMAIGEETGCMYRTMTGACCFIGALIPNERYHPSLERASGIDQSVLRAVGVPSATSMLQNFLLEAQSIHDSHGVEEDTEKSRVAWAERLSRLFTKFHIPREAYL